MGRRTTPFFYGWVIAGIAFLNDFSSSGLGGATVSLFYKPMAQDTGWSLSQLQGAITAQSIAAMIVAPFLGQFIDRFGVKKVMIWGVFAPAAGMVAMSFIHALWQFWLLYALIGALGLAEIGQMTTPIAIARWFVRKRSRVLALSTTGQTVGGMVLAPLLAALIFAVGWRTSWAIMGIALAAVLGTIVLLFMRDNPSDMGLLPDGDPIPPSGSPAAQAGAPEVIWTVREAFRTRAMWLFVLGLSLSGWSLGPLIYNAVPFFVNQKHMSVASSGWILAGILGAGTAARVFWAFVVEKVPVRFCFTAVCIFRGLGIISLFVVPYPWSIGTFMVLTNFLGAGFGLLQPLTWAAYFGHRSMGRIQGATRPFNVLPNLIGPFGMAILYERTGTFTVGFLIAAGLAFLGAIAMFFAKPPPKRTAG